MVATSDIYVHVGIYTMVVYSRLNFRPVKF